MKLLTVKKEIKTEKQFPGLIECQFVHEIKSATGSADYKGPLITPEAWQEVLAFFQWTYDTTHSESQVRLFVNVRDRIWKAWAFPQEARSGMSARELDTPDKAKQRAQFADSDGWVYFGTVHHHCSASAFQSGTDRDNEENQDGLHITIGNMSSPRYDMHSRFYIGGCGFEPDMAKFWDVGDFVRQQVPPNLWDGCARHQMCAKVAPSTEYPAQWRENLIEVKTHFPVSQGTTQVGAVVGGSRPWEGYGSGGSRTEPITANMAVWLKARKAVGELVTYIETTEEYINTTNTADEMAENLLKEMFQGNGDWSIISEVARICGKWGISPADMWTEVPADGNCDSCVNSYLTHLGDYRGRHGAQQKSKEEKKDKDNGAEGMGSHLGYSMD